MSSEVFSGTCRKVDFFIIGAPKCGTSALYEYLRQHPGIFLPECKVEPHYFARDIALSGRHRNLESYLRLFEPAPAGALVGEASTWYLYSKCAIDGMLEHNPEAKFIVMLRNPVDMAHSLHAFNLVKLHEDIESFEIAWNLQGARRAGKKLPRGVVDTNFVLYYDACALSRALERVMERVPKDNLLIHCYEDFFDDIQESYNRTLDFLGLSRRRLTAMPRVNGYRVLRSRLLAKFINNPKGLLGRSYEPIRSILNKMKLHPGRAIYRFNEIASSRPELPIGLRKRLLGAFADNNERIRVLTGMSLDAWRE